MGKMQPLWHFSIIFRWIIDGDQYARAIAYDGLASTYANYFGDPWKSVNPHIQAA